MKQTLIIKDRSTSLEIHKEYMVLNFCDNETVVSFRHIDKLYINKHIDIKSFELVYLASILKLFIIDRFGNILAEVKYYAQN